METNNNIKFNFPETAKLENGGKVKLGDSKLPENTEIEGLQNFAILIGKLLRKVDKKLHNHIW